MNSLVTMVTHKNSKAVIRSVEKNRALLGTLMDHSPGQLLQSITAIK